MTTPFPAVVAFPPILFASDMRPLFECLSWICAISVGLALLLGAGTAGLVVLRTHRRKNWWLTPFFAFFWFIAFVLAGMAFDSWLLRRICVWIER
jgi:hypothetical protein